MNVLKQVSRGINHLWGVARILSFAGFLLWAPRAEAHTFPVSEIDHSSEIQIGRNRISIAYGITISELQAMRGMWYMNLNGDNVITDEERYAYFGQLSEDIVKGIRFFWDDHPLKVENPRKFELRKPYGMTYFFQAKLDSNSRGLHKFLFLDTNDAKTPGTDTIRFRGDTGADVRHSATGRRRAIAWVAVGNVPDSGLPLELSKGIWNDGENITTAATNTRPAAEAATPWISGSSSAKAGSSYERIKGRIEEVLQGRLSLFIVISTLCLAFLIGALHALQPGHGKTLVAAYLVGSKGTIWHAILLGAVVTFTHTFSVIALGIAALYFSARVLPETLNLWLSLISGMMVAVMGLWMFLNAYRRWVLHREGKLDITAHGHAHLFGCGHGHSHDQSDHDQYEEITSHSHDLSDHGHVHHGGQGHEHSHEHAINHDHDTETPVHNGDKGGISLWSLFSMGIVGGMVPCVDAIVLLLIAVALHRVALGLLIILIFSLGIAAVLVSVGIIVVKAKGLTDRFDRGHNLMARLPLVSAAIITIIGFAMLFKSMLTAGIIRLGS